MGLVTKDENRQTGLVLDPTDLYSIVSSLEIRNLESKEESDRLNIEYLKKREANILQCFNCKTNKMNANIIFEYICKIVQQYMFLILKVE